MSFRSHSEATPRLSAQIAEYLDHNELGLAFATIVEVMDEGDLTPSAATMTRLRAAHERMGCPRDGAAAWERLARRSR